MSIYDKAKEIWHQPCPVCTIEITYDMDWPEEIIVYISDSKIKYYHKHCWKEINPEKSVSETNMFRDWIPNTS